MQKEIYEFISKQTQDPIVEWRTCAVSGTQFPIFQSDQEFYKKISPTFGGKKYLIPFPTLCPEERERRRMMFRNERKLYKRKCDFSGKPIISIYTPESPYKVYDQKVWRGDDWDAMDYSINFDFEKSFSEQFKKLMLDVPKLSLNVEQQENTEFSNYAGWNRDSYLIFLGANNEKCYYCNAVWDSKFSMDCSYSSFLYKCYHIIDSKNCYSCMYSQFLEDCSDCVFCYDIIGKQYCVFNKQLTKDEYYKFIQEFGNRKDLGQYFNKYDVLINTNIKRAYHNYRSENVFGEYIKESTNVSFSHDITNCEDCKFVDWLFHSKHCCDVFDRGDSAENCYECHKIGNNVSNICFSAFCLSNVDHVTCCYDCVNNCSHCFACVGLKNKQYCIFNKQYTKEAYKKLVPQIIEHMQSTGERGEFFDSSLSPFGYNETVAQEYFPLTREEALERGYKRQDKEYPINIPAGMETILGKNLPDTIEEVDDSILQKAIICEVSGKPFRIIKLELEFYRKHKFPLPRKHPDVRHQERLAKRPGRELFLRHCDKCGKEMLSVYAKNNQNEELGAKIGESTEKQKVYCEQCYVRDVYG